MARYHGKKGVVYLSTTGTGAAANVGNLTEWSLSFASEKVDVTSFGDLNKTYVLGMRDVTGSFRGWFDDAATAALMTAAESSDGIKAYIYPSADAALRYFYGPCWVDLSIQGGIGSAVSVSGNIAANGSWGSKLA